MLQVFRGEILHFLDDPAKCSLNDSYQHFVDGVLVVENGHVVKCGDAETLLPHLTGDYQLTTYENGLIIPGMIDTHVHFPQIEMIASYGEQLLEWLEKYTFPAEREFSDHQHGLDMAEFFLQQLLASGTTTALVFGTVHKESVDAFFTVAQQMKLRMICGKVLMDQNCPEDLQDTPETGYQDSKALIERWHKKERLQYAVTPRFAPTCSFDQLAKAGQLLQEYPDVYLHTHLAENQQEIEWVKSLFPECDGYLDVYDQAKLLTKRSVFAHGVHLCDSDCERLGETQSAVAFCPSSNLFLGSGLFDLPKLQKHEVKVGIGSDVGAGTSLSIMKNLSEGYKIQQLRGDKLTPFQGLYLATMGGAKTLDLDDRIGNFLPGKEADFTVLDLKATPLLTRRLAKCVNLAEKLFVLMMLSDERHIKATHILGKRVGEAVYKS